ncbi:MAG: hemerythrin domain-containing protein [Candidatus Nitrosocaldus sp.]|nr:hemerythrin domain-containing protein [Candidatus Nitrosocaldus sp.]MCS7141374.1 hemerythrin domain-containing protein [Candidatus Nitrosocaldus sp.]MDW8000736.1 hemerythrin domain-containing protein [Candidatus Nitrosocaldus sp.]MDW8275723.1 hemerythrin domain-containing protein [Candidatus Nitrosocaldus sp.]
MSATSNLREDHRMVRRIHRMVRRYSEIIYGSGYVPVEDVKKILILVEMFIDAYHHFKEECSYFPAVKGSMLEDEARALMVEHELGRRIARMLNMNLDAWLREQGSEPVARMLKAYAEYLYVHMDREERFFASYDAMVQEQEQSKIMDAFDTIRRERMGDDRLRLILSMLDELEQRAGGYDYDDQGS